MLSLRGLLLLVAFSAACTLRSGPSEADNINETMSAWMGHTLSDLIAEWGPPDQETNVEDGARVLTYNRALWQESDPISCDNLFPTHDPVAADIECIRRRAHVRDVHGAQMFWSDRAGKLVRYSWRVTR
jgi:hypothetical protein